MFTNCSFFTNSQLFCDVVFTISAVWDSLTKKARITVLLMCYNMKCNPSFTFSRNETTTEPTEEETSENDDLTDKDYVKESNGTTKIVNNDNYEGEIRAEIASNELERNKNERKDNCSDDAIIHADAAVIENDKVIDPKRNVTEDAKTDNYGEITKIEETETLKNGTRRKDDSSEGRDDSFHSKILLERWRQSSGDIAHLTSFINYFQTGIYGQPEKVGLSSNHTN